MCAVTLVAGPRDKYGRRLDHNHTTLKLRGFLCHHCNSGIGHVRELIETLRALLRYLAKDIGPVEAIFRQFPRKRGRRTKRLHRTRVENFRLDAEGRTCMECLEYKTYSEFHKNYTCCKSCKRGRMQRLKHGVVPEAYAALLKLARGGCEACGNSNRDGLCVDHCHATDRIRGILCFHCNLGLGHFRDNPDIIRAAIAYLEYWAAVHAAEEAAKAA